MLYFIFLIVSAVFFFAEFVGSLVYIFFLHGEGKGTAFVLGLVGLVLASSIITMLIV